MGEIRRAELPADGAAVAQLRWQWARDADPRIPAWNRDAQFTAQVRQWLDDPMRTVWIAVLSDQPIGLVCLTEYTRMPSPRPGAAGSWGYLGHLYVSAEHRRRGAGGRLIDAALAEADCRGYSKVVLSPSDQSIPLYRGRGFTIDNNLMVRPNRMF